VTLDLFWELHWDGGPGPSEQPAGSATFSPCGLYRYRLERRLPRGSRTMALVMLNPSKAGADEDDQTVTKVIRFSERIDVGRFIVVNAAALISTDPKGLARAADPIGPDNDRHILEAAREADIVVVAWGGGVSNLRGKLATRPAQVLDLLRADGHELWCWGFTKDGHPRHPLMLRYSTSLERFRPWACR
jgi:hypothetical protein